MAIIEADGQTALIIDLPEINEQIKHIRNDYDPAAHLMDAHITILIPFKPKYDLSEEDYSRLENMFSKFKPFVLNFNSFGRFPHVLFLKPQESPLIGSMFQELRDIFPEVKPYGGRISNFVPHVTLAQHPNETYLDIVQEKHGQHVLGLQEHINHVQLHVIRDKKWELLRTFSF